MYFIACVPQTIISGPTRNAWLDDLIEKGDNLEKGKYS